MEVRRCHGQRVALTISEAVAVELADADYRHGEDHASMLQGRLDRLAEMLADVLATLPERVALGVLNGQGSGWERDDGR